MKAILHFNIKSVFLSKDYRIYINDYNLYKKTWFFYYSCWRWIIPKALEREREGGEREHRGVRKTKKRTTEKKRKEKRCISFVLNWTKVASTEKVSTLAHPLPRYTYSKKTVLNQSDIPKLYLKNLLIPQVAELIINHSTARQIKARQQRTSRMKDLLQYNSRSNWGGLEYYSEDKSSTQETISHQSKSLTKVTNPWKIIFYHYCCTTTIVTLTLAIATSVTPLHHHCC